MGSLWPASKISSGGVPTHFQHFTVFQYANLRIFSEKWIFVSGYFRTFATENETERFSKFFDRLV